MKISLIFLFITAGFVYCQNSYLIDKDVFIFGVEDDGLLTAKQKNNKAHIKHYDISGNIIWQDSISFSGAVDNSEFRWISKFPNTDDYVICMESDLTSLNYGYFANDTSLYHFTKLNLPSHQFTNDREDSSFLNVIEPIEYNDTSLYLSITDLTNGSSNFHHATYSLNSNFQISLVAPIDSVSLYSFGWKYFHFGDSLYKYQNFFGNHFIEKYSNQMSLLQRIDYDVITGEQYNQVVYSNAINYDSLLIFTQGYTNGGIYRTQWRFDWRQIDLFPISTVQLNSNTNDPSTNQVKGYMTNYNKVAVDRINRKIIILAEEDIMSYTPPYSSKTFESILIYDFDFNFICEVPVSVAPSAPGDMTDNKLIELNGLVYLQSQGVNYQNLTLIDCNTLGMNKFKVESLDVTIFPNPVEDKLNIVNDKGVELKIQIQSLEGKVMKIINGNDTKIKIDLSELLSGVYIIVIEGEGKVTIERIIKK